MDKETAKRRFQELVEGNPRTVRIIRSPAEIDGLNMDKIMAAGGPNVFGNYDEAMLTFISKCLSEGKEVAIQAAGPQKLIVHAARGLFRGQAGADIALDTETQATPTGSKKGGVCFVATAACGDPQAPEVLALSAFRDDVLTTSRIGRVLMRLYYSVSPPIAGVIARSSTLRRIAMTVVVRPAVRVCTSLQCSQSNAQINRVDERDSTA